MKRSWSLLVAALWASVAAAQNVPPALMVKPKGKPEPLSITRAVVEARIFGYLAETKMTLTFHNPHDQALAGDLYFPLPEGATVSGYALDVGDEMVDGVIVEKHKGRQVFEKELRKGIDPGLVEWVKGNSFRTRVFPIPARGSRRVRVEYVTELAASENGTTWRLPLKFKDKVGQFALRVEVVKAAAEPKVAANGPPRFQFARWRDSFVAETTLKDAAPNEDLVIALPEVEKQTVLVEKTPDGQVYFCINDFPAPPAVEPPPPPARVTILWDASGSRGRTGHERELELLEAFLAGLSVTADLVVFRNAAQPVRHFEIKDGDAGKLLSELVKVPYDGGTQVGCISPPPDQAQPNFYLLFTDGMSNFGIEDPAGLKSPLYILSAYAAANHPFLRYLAIKTGGQYFNLNRLSDKAVLAAIGRPAFSFIAATPGGVKLGEMYPRLARPVRGRFTLVGKLTVPETPITLHYGIGGKETVSSRCLVSAADAVEGDLLRRFWAQKKLEELMIFPKGNKEQITALGKEYGLVTPGTSLIVLERLEQYVEHEIAPPKSLPEMRNKYLAAMDAKAAERKQQEESKLQAVLALWQQRVEWWQQEFKYPKDFRYKPQTSQTAPSQGALFQDYVGAIESSTQPVAAFTPARVRATVPAPAPADMLLPEARAFVRTDLRPLLPARQEELRYPGDRARAEVGRRGQPAIAIKEWDPKTPYLAELSKAPAGEAFAVYMAQRKERGGSPGFFLDCADFFLRHGQQPLAIQVLSNLAELELESAALLRVLAHRLAQMDELDLAVGLFEEALRLRPEEPQSHRDLAMVLARRAERKSLLLQMAGRTTAEKHEQLRAQAAADYRRAMKLLAKVVMNRWDRFEEIEVIGLMELNRLIPKAREAGVKELPLDERLIRLLDMDVRIVLTWDADLTDMDLHVVEPSGERAYYEHNRTTIGGLISRDFTEGYGPEEYVLRKAMRGTYSIQVNYFGSQAPALIAPVTVQAELFTNFGRADEKRKSVTLRLKQQDQTLSIGDIEF